MVEQTCLDSNSRADRNLWQFAEGAKECWRHLIPTTKQIRAAVTLESSMVVLELGNTNHLQATVEMIFSAWTNYEAIVQGLLNQWGDRAHGFVPVEMMMM